MQKNNQIDEVTQKAIKSLNEIATENNVIGKPIIAGGLTVIPLTKVSLAFMSGGGEYGSVKVVKANKKFPCTLGSGAVVSLKPSGFLIINKNQTKIVRADSDIYDRLLNKAEEVFSANN
mgnify:FL=1